MGRKRSIFTFRELKEWKADVNARDNYTCQECGGVKPAKRLCAHHIKPKEEFPEFAFDVDNGLTLCNPCHSQLHNIGKQHALGYLHTPKQNEALSKRMVGNQYALGKHWKLTEVQKKACSQRITAEQKESLRKRSTGNQYGLGHNSYIQTPEQKENSKKRATGQQYALGYRWTPEQNAAKSQRTKIYWAKVKSGEIVRKPRSKDKGETNV